jgi:hypothetical protein
MGMPRKTCVPTPCLCPSYHISNYIVHVIIWVYTNLSIKKKQKGAKNCHPVPGPVPPARVWSSTSCHWNGIHLNPWDSLYITIICLQILSFCINLCKKSGKIIVFIITRPTARCDSSYTGQTGVSLGRPAAWPAGPVYSPVLPTNEPTHQFFLQSRQNTCIYVIPLASLLLMTCTRNPVLSPSVFSFTGDCSDGSHVAAKRGKHERPPGCRIGNRVPNKAA